MADTSVLGRPLWYELLTTDMKGAEAFYTTVVGWSVTPFDDAPEPYDMWTRHDGAPIGGVMRLPRGLDVPPNWGMFVGVPALEEGIRRVEELGGRALSPVIDIPEVGRTRTMQDPQGAAFSIYEPARPPSPGETEPQVGDASWHELYTTDDEAAIRFYATLFGWRQTESMDMGEMGQYHIFARTFPLGGVMRMPPQMGGVPPHWNIYFRVPRVDDAADRVTANGGQVLNGPMEVPGGDWIINCMDPQGAAFSLHHRAG